MPTYEYRCPTCKKRFNLILSIGEHDAKKAKCPKCGSEWRIFWVKAGFPRVKGPVWETSQRLANEQWAKLQEQKKEEK